MKPIIIDMKEMSDSTEVYEARPNPVLTWFIYLILAMAAAAFLWMSLCKMDIVVKGAGTVAAADEVATVTNQVNGIITGRMIEDGQNVEKGDVLYTVSHEDLSLQLSSLEEQLADCTEKEQMLKAYENWLQTGEEFPELLTDNIYYREMTARKQLAALGEKGALQEYTGELAAYDAKLTANSGLTDYYRDSIRKSKQLIEAMRNRENTFAKDETYYFNTVENYLVQYQNTLEQYDDKVKALLEEKETAEKQLENLRKNEQDPLIETGTVSGGDGGLTAAALSENVEAQIETQKALIETANASIQDYNTQRNNALDTYEAENIAAVEKSILAYEQNVKANESTRLEYQNGQEVLVNQGTEVRVENMITQESHSVAGELENCRQSKQQMGQQIEGLRQDIENATATAAISGKVNFNIDLVEGDFVAAGTQVMSIIPDTEEGAFTARSYVENKDIAKIREGMEVTYEIAAYPAGEYGAMKGEVTFVSADLKVNNSGSAYYVVETSIDASNLYNRLGDEAALKVGMLCETKIIVEEKSVLTVLLEKLFHL